MLSKCWNLYIYDRVMGLSPWTSLLLVPRSKCMGDLAYCILLYKYLDLKVLELVAHKTYNSEYDVPKAPRRRNGASSVRNIGLIVIPIPHPMPFKNRPTRIKL